MSTGAPPSHKVRVTHFYKGPPMSPGDDAAIPLPQRPAEVQSSGLVERLRGALSRSTASLIDDPQAAELSQRGTWVAPFQAEITCWFFVMLTGVGLHPYGVEFDVDPSELRTPRGAKWLFGCFQRYVEAGIDFADPKRNARPFRRGTNWKEWFFRMVACGIVLPCLGALGLLFALGSSIPTLNEWFTDLLVPCLVVLGLLLALALWMPSLIECVFWGRKAANPTPTRQAHE